MEYFDTDLKQLIQCGKSIRLTGEHIKTITYNLLCALQFLHKSNVIHRDIKPANIFINKNCEVKIGDFGISRSQP
jgi:serine/threonine protein kinase